jgi:hypothetical protein
VTRRTFLRGLAGTDAAISEGLLAGNIVMKCSLTWQGRKINAPGFKSHGRFNPTTGTPT